MQKLRLTAISLFCLLIFFIIAYAGIGDSRDSWQQSEKIMDSVGVKPGMVIGEIGAGEGYLTFKLSNRVGEAGRIYANDIDKGALKKLRDRFEREEIHNITTVVGNVDDPVFPVDCLDMVIMILVFHDLDKPVKLMENVKKYLKPDANVVIIERDPKKWGSGHDHFDSKETILATVKKADYDLVRLETFLSRDNIFIYSPKVEE